MLMKKIILLSSLLAIALAAEAQKTTRVENPQARLVDVSPSAFVRPLVADLKVDDAKGRISDVWTLQPSELAGLLNGDMSFDQKLENLRNYALSRSVQKHNCDVIVAPTFNISTTDFAKGVSITVMGFTANFTNWRTMSDADIIWVNAERSDPHKLGQQYNPTNSPTRQK